METRKKDTNANYPHERPRDKLEVEELTRGLKVRSDKPHLVSLGGGRLSTAVSLLPLDEGITRIGSAEGQDIRIHGPEVNKEHCYIENEQAIITLCPLNKSLVSIDGERILQSVVLTQGCMLCLGRANYFRFNHPEQAMKLRGTNAPMDSKLSHSTDNQEEESKGHTSDSDTSSASSVDDGSTGNQSPIKYRDDLTKQSFKSKLKRFEHLTHAQQQEETTKVMSPPPVTNHNKFSYLNNYVGEKLFTKDTSTTRLSADEAHVNDSTARRESQPANCNTEQQTKPPKPEVKPKPVPGYGKPKPRLEPGKANISPPMAGSGRNEFKTLSMISTETSIWGSTSSANTVRLDDELPSPLSCHTPTDYDPLDHPDVFSDEMTSSLTMKHQQMIEERKLEEAMEKKEQERLEEILAMCAQYEQQIDSEQLISQSTLTSPGQSSVNKTSPSRTLTNKTDTYSLLTSKATPPGDLDINKPLTSNFPTSSYHGSVSSSVKTSTAMTSVQMPDVLTDSIHSVMSSSFSDRRNIKTNGSLIQSPTSPPRTSVSAFSYSGKLTSTSNPTYSKAKFDAYQDDAHLYDCPADYDIKPKTDVSSKATTSKTTTSKATTSKASQGLVLNTSMTASIYADDERIYDAPADMMVLPPPVPSHKRLEPPHSNTDSNLTESADNRQRNHRSIDSSSSELTVVSSAGSYKTALPELSSSFTDNNKADDVCNHFDNLKSSKGDLLEKLRLIKHKIMDIETQQTEAVRELEMEQALLQGEQQTELNHLQAHWEETDSLKSKRLMVINSYTKQQQERLIKIEEAREKLYNMEQRRVEIEEQLRVAPDEEKDDLLAMYETELDALENQKKVFEDLEFQQLEMEAKYEEETEAVQREINGKQGDLVSKIKRAEDNLAHMTRQQTDMMEQTRLELDDMERQRKILVAEFQREKQKMMSLDNKMKDAQKNYGGGMTNSRHSEHDELLLKSPSATLDQNLVARMRPGDIIMEEERRRLESLKHAATEASILQWHEQRSLENNLRRFGTLDSEEEVMSTRSSETPSDGDKISYNSSMDDQDRFTELQLLLAQARHHVQNAENSDLAMERRLRANLEQQLAEEKMRRDELVEEQVQMREKNSSNANNMQRPLTRYLPVREEKFDLRSHVESTGHNLGSCPFVEVTPNKCKGYLLKMGTKVKTWNKRWFVFDREKKSLLYYMDKSESKPRGGIYFQSIEDVFVDHMRTVKSPNQKFTFCVKTYDKPYYLVAKSPEALSIWIDVIFTGAEGYQEF